MQYKNLTFPLNVYAYSLILEEGKVHYLHYGFDPQINGIYQAQQNSTDFIMKQLPAAPIDILEVGIGICTTATKLVKAGYNYTGVVPDSVQIAMCREKQLNVIESKFESMQVDKKYDLILFQESAQYIAPQALLQQAYRLLKPMGQVLVLDEVETQAIDSLEQLAIQVGFEIVDKKDFTEQAAPTLNYLIEIMYKHRSTILQDLQLSGDKFSKLMYSLEIRNKAYQEQKYSYMFFKLERINKSAPMTKN
jgi:ubiquinone/menaquinone biosynthesis C-methylase UbiE